MKQSLQLKLGQSLTMTPQLQQAIRLLQLSSLELQTEIQEILETNPMLETADEAAEQEQAVSDKEKEKNSESGSDSDSTSMESADSNNDSRETDVGINSDDLPNELPTDSSWEDTYDNYMPTTRSAEGENRAYEQADHSDESLLEHLMWQMELTPFSDTDRLIATAIIDSIDQDGYLSSTLEDIHQGLLSDDPEIEMDEVESVLIRVQNFDPPGIAARDLRENMQLQLNYLDPETPHLENAKRVVYDFFDLLANRDFNLLLRRMKVSETELQQAIGLIQSLTPRPGSQISNSQPEYIVPDVFVRKVKGKWKVDLNPDVTPRLAINSMYAGMASGNNSTGNYLKNHLQEARWFLKSLKSRNETLLKVATCIVERQRAFLDYGDEAMKPLVMHDVAEVVEMHESTISRVTTKKYMHTPRGIYELKYFFSSHVSTASGGECSATAIRAMLKKLIAAEQHNKPLSDNKLATMLSKQGINVARRTVAKYREAMSIPPSNERKRMV